MTFNIARALLHVTYYCYQKSSEKMVLWNFQCGDCFYTSESDVYIHENVTSKYDHRTERIKNIMVTEDPEHMYTHMERDS